MGANDILSWVLTPLIEPVKTLLAHALRKNCDTAARHDAANCNAPSGVVASRWPDCPVTGRVELTGDDAWRKT